MNNLLNKNTGAEETAPVYYDLHIHSCLSPCGDQDMTVNNIINMSLLKGLSLIALTDHNSCKNCPAFLEAAAGKLWVIPGMELCTSEEIHVVCLFPGLEQAMAFDEYVSAHSPKIKNRPAIYGPQTILNSLDEIIGEEENLLITATDISFDKVPGLIRQFEGLAFPAHINKDSFSALAVLGFIPPESGYRVLEIANHDAFLNSEKNRKLIKGFKTLENSDAHYLIDIKEDKPPLLLNRASFRGLIDYFNS